MKGLEIAESYFWEHGAPLIERQFSAYKERIAAGLVGEGSECFGYDDEISRDHDWGPGFCLWLNKEDYRAIGAKLEAALADLPAAFGGVGPRKVTEWGEGRVGVFETTEFYRGFIGFSHVPLKINEWRLIPEVNLATATNGKVFTDPLGEFTNFREGLINYFPEDVRLKKIASRLMAIFQLGQYNYLRSVQRQEAVATRYVEAQFCTQVISLVFLLNRRYPPFYKWMHRALKELPILGEVVYKLLLDIVLSYGHGQKSRLMDETCAHILEELRRQDLSNLTSKYLLDHGPVVQRKIKDKELRKVDVRLE